MPPRKREDYISVKPCPICGEHPEKQVQSLAKPGGGGYPGHSYFWYKCECCDLLAGDSSDDVYRSTAEAINNAKTYWNEEVDRVQTYLDRIYVKRTEGI